MKSLIFLAHPAKESFNKEIAKVYKEAAEKRWDKAEIINLYDKKYSQNFLKFDKIYEIPEDEVKNKLQNKMSKADEYIFIFPIWWGWVPAILKNFFDTNLSSWFAFEFEKWWKVKKLLNWKTAKIFCTCDAPWFIYKIPFILWISIKAYLSKAILWFCWIKVNWFNLYSQLRKMTNEERKKILKNIY